MDVFSALWGSNPSGSPHHVVRKIPMKVEPKSYYSNERTFLSWLKMATALGGVSSAVFGFKKANEDDEEDPVAARNLISQSTINAIYTCMLPLSLLMIIYAFLVCSRRRFCLKTKQAEMRSQVTSLFNDQIGPTCIASAVIGVLLVIYGCTLRDVMSHT